MQKYIFIKIDSFQLILLICKLKNKSKGIRSVIKFPLRIIVPRSLILQKQLHKAQINILQYVKIMRKYSSDIKAKNVIKKVSSNIKKCQATCN